MTCSESRLVVFDLDGTMTRRDTFRFFLLGYLRRHPKRLLYVAHLSLAFLLYAFKLRDNHWLKASFVRTILKGADRAPVSRWAEEFVDRVVQRGVRGSAMDRLSRHKAEGCRLVLATASPDIYVRHLAERMGFDDVICTCLEWTNDDKLTGQILGKNCYGAEKMTKLGHWMREFGISKIVAAYSDRLSDYDLLFRAERGVLINPRRREAKVARRRGIDIEFW